MELNEKDIKAVAESRYHRRYGLRLVLFLAVGFVAMFVLLCFLPKPWNYAALLPAVCLGVVWLRYAVLMNRSVKALVGEWKEGQKS